MNINPLSLRSGPRYALCALLGAFVPAFSFGQSSVRERVRDDDGVTRARDVRVMIKRRMCKVINRKLKEMEQGMQSGDMEPAELERHTKVVTSMIGGLQKVGGPVTKLSGFSASFVDRFAARNRFRQ